MTQEDAIRLIPILIVAAAVTQQQPQNGLTDFESRKTITAVERQGK